MVFSKAIIELLEFVLKKKDKKIEDGLYCRGEARTVASASIRTD